MSRFGSKRKGSYSLIDLKAIQEEIMESLHLKDIKDDISRAGSKHLHKYSEFIRKFEIEFKASDEKSSKFKIVYKATEKLTGEVGALLILKHSDELERDKDIEVYSKGVYGEEIKNLRKLSRLENTNLVSIIAWDIFEEQNKKERAYIFEEWVNGETLAKKLDFSEYFNMSKVLDWSLQLTNGIAAAHKISIVHQDLRPENIMITEDNILVILDWGTAQSCHALKIPTLGAISFRAPEQTKEEGVFKQSDIYSIGTLMYFLLTGEHPLLPNGLYKKNAPESRDIIIEKHKNPDLHTITPLNARLKERGINEVPKKLEDIVMKCLKYDKNKRYIDGGVLHNELLNYPRTTLEKVFGHLKNRIIFYIPPALLMLGYFGYLHSNNVNRQIENNILEAKTAMSNNKFDEAQTDINEIRSQLYSPIYRIFKNDEEVQKKFFQLSSNFDKKNSKENIDSFDMWERSIEDKLNEFDEMIKAKEIGAGSKVEEYIGLLQTELIDHSRYEFIGRLSSLGEKLIQYNPDQESIIRIHMNHKTGQMYLYRRDYKSALEKLKISESMIQEYGWRKWVEHEIGNVYRLRGDYDLAIGIFKDELEKNKIDDNFLGWVNQKIGTTLLYQGDIKNAKEYFDKSTAYFSQIHDPKKERDKKIGLTWTDFERSIALIAEKNYEEAEGILNNTLSAFKKLDSLEGLIWTNFRLGQIYLRKGQYSSARAKFENCLSMESETVKLQPAIAFFKAMLARTLVEENKDSTVAYGIFYESIMEPNFDYKSTENYRDAILIYYSNLKFLESMKCCDKDILIITCKNRLNEIKKKIGEEKYNMFVTETRQFEW